MLKDLLDLTEAGAFRLVDQDDSRPQSQSRGNQHSGWHVERTVNRRWASEEVGRTGGWCLVLGAWCLDACFADARQAREWARSKRKDSEWDFGGVQGLNLPGWWWWWADGEEVQGGCSPLPSFTGAEGLEGAEVRGPAFLFVGCRGTARETRETRGARARPGPELFRHHGSHSITDHQSPIPEVSDTRRHDSSAAKP
jgi:hypothetical protein